MAKPELHQVLESVSPGDATSDHAFLIRDWLREFGFESKIYAASCHESLASEVQLFRPGRMPAGELLIFHHTIGSPAMQQLIAQRTPLLLIYHNITPPEFFKDADPALARDLIEGQRQLVEVRPQVRLAVGASPYSEAELQALGFEQTGVLPIVLNEGDYDLAPQDDLQERLKAGGPLLLFVGRIVPNKCQEDLLKLLYYVRLLEPQARLALVGDQTALGYGRWLNYFARRYGLDGAVEFAGHVTQQEMVTYYRSADLFLSMSEHEGFGKPLIESMYLGVPVMAYAAAAVPSTLGDAGILFTQKEFEPLAHLVQLLIRNQSLRSQIIETQYRRVNTFLEPAVKQRFYAYLEQLGLK